MALRIEFEVNHHQGDEDLWLPVLVCDVCGERIAHVGNGAHAWLMQQGTRHGELSPLYTVHQETCMTALRDKLEVDGGLMGWHMLDRLIIALAVNTEMTDEETAGRWLAEAKEQRTAAR